MFHKNFIHLFNEFRRYSQGVCFCANIMYIQKPKYSVKCIKVFCTTKMHHEIVKMLEATLWKKKYHNFFWHLNKFFNLPTRSHLWQSEKLSLEQGSLAYCFCWHKTFLKISDTKTKSLLVDLEWLISADELFITCWCDLWTHKMTVMTQQFKWTMAKESCAKFSFM